MLVEGVTWKLPESDDALCQDHLGGGRALTVLRSGLELDS